ncbi:MAG: TonB-dependent receptor [Alphaproteobacteria bacterium]|nr:TonB-dependent receptor [Alphaproteobacteria bacterium]
MTVTGFRQSVITSEAIKKNSLNIVEAVSAEDIGKLPDVSIAESLSRLPGLAAQRVNGRDQVIDIRGLSPDFAGTTFNGRDQVSTGDNRGVEFDQFPAEILTGATVYKTADPTIIGAGLSGTIDLKSARPLDYEGRELAFGARGEYNTLGKISPEVSPFGQRYNLTYIDQFADRKFGIAFGFAHLDSPFENKYEKDWWWQDDPTLESWWAHPNEAGYPPNAWGMWGTEAGVITQSQVRDGAIMTLEAQPNEHFHSTLDLYWSNFNQKEHDHVLQFTTDPWTKDYPDLAQIAFTNPDGSTGVGGLIQVINPKTTTVGGAELVTSGAWNGVRPLVMSRYNTRVDVLHSVGWRNEYTTDRWTLSADVNYSDAKRHETNSEYYAGRTSVDHNFGFSLPTTPMYPTYTPSLDYADPTQVLLYDAQEYGHDGRVQYVWQKDTIQAARLDVRYDIGGVIDNIQLGANFQTRVKNRSFEVYFATLNPGLTAPDGRTVAQVSPDLLYKPISLSFVGIPSIMAFDVPAVASKYYTFAVDMSQDDWSKDFTVKEKVLTTYVKADYKTHFFGIDVKGTVGGQFIHTDQFSHAFNVDNASSSTAPSLNATGARSYNDFLPSVSAIADFGEGSLLRIVVAKAMARPRVDELRAAASATVSTSSDIPPNVWSGSGGNPRLLPWRADCIDVSFEHYINESSYFQIAGFYKNLRSYVYQQTIDNFDFSGYTVPVGAHPISNFGSFYTWANGTGGYVRGMEVSGQVDGKLLSDMLDGFGALGSFSWTDTSIKPDGPGTALTATLPGLSKAVADLSVYYESNGFSVRVAEKYRSDFRGEIASLFGNRSFTRILGEMQTDFQMSYDFQAGTLNGMSILLQVNNLSDTPYRTVQDSLFAGGSRQPLEYDRYGRQFLLGLNYKL